ncbi:TauD/TfdA family dioxygenase [Streptomyces virginiae]|uniref:TauD/TfdA family dioxygenase n=1 Tax=Streptomyces virginiae TaxID=1961 RepID=UPI0036BAD236
MSQSSSLDAFASEIGPIHHTEYGRYITLRSIPGTTDLAETGHPLSPHTDVSVHMHIAPLLQFMFCLEHEAEGGDSILVDGFKVAEDFRAHHPENFARLVNTPVSFQQFYTNFRYFLKRTGSVIEVDASGRVDGVFFAHSHACNWSLPPDEMEPFYDAYYAFFRYLKNPAYQLRTRLRAGQCVALRNGRMLHGRTGFDANSGPRAIIDEFVAWEHFEARIRFHENKHLYSRSPEAALQGAAAM